LVRDIQEKLSYTTERQHVSFTVHTSFSAHSLIVHFTEHRICCIDTIS